MADVASFESRDARIDREIQDGIDAIRGRATIVLPGPDAAVVASYVQKIGGACDVDRARKDTENAIDLLSIAYHAIPQTEGEIRVGITAVMNGLVASQQKSQLAMQRAVQVATGVIGQLEDAFPDWLDAKEAGDRAAIERFVAGDLRHIEASIAAKAIAVRDQILAIASSYDDILAQAADAAAKGEATLSARLADPRTVESERDEARAGRGRREARLEDLKARVAEFEREAQDAGRRAGPAGQRSPAAAAVRVGAQALARAVPAAARAVGPAGLLASSILRAPAAGGTRDGAEPGRPPVGRHPAAALRDAQLRLIDGIESYERERLGQSAALADVAALLQGRRTEQETIRLALKALDVSLDALGRLKEIAEEVAALSVALSDSGVGELVDLQAGAGEVPEGRAERLDATVDAFFVRQAARWHAVAVVSDRFGKHFAEGWSRINTLSGTYITGDQLGAYLKEASARLTAIVAEREAAVARTIASLQDRRETLTRDA